MNVASKELCERLDKLSGWKVLPRSEEGQKTLYWVKLSIEKDYDWELWSGASLQHEKPDVILQAYDLGYLLRKLPKYIALKNDCVAELTLCSNGNEGRIEYLYYGVSKSPNYIADSHFSQSGSLEDATAKLAIELHKQNILTRE